MSGVEHEYVIPVAFTVNGLTERQAAARLAEILTAVKLIDRKDDAIEEWWMPNHPIADGSDREAVLIWIPMMSYAGRATENERPQDSVDNFMRALSSWHGEK
jgi:hypothetical protein